MNPEPADLVDEAIARLAEDESGLGDFVAALSPGDEADLRGGALDSVTHFVESFPPLDRRWRPVVESTIRWPVAGPIQLRGKVDLVIGPPRGAESTKVLIDLKTGNTAEVHRHDLRFYALIETLVRSVPPRKLASFYLDAGEPISRGRHDAAAALGARPHDPRARPDGRPRTRTSATHHVTGLAVHVVSAQRRLRRRPSLAVRARRARLEPIVAIS